ncbi:MAG: type III polyketide synthase [Hyphomicrobiales bacterium]|nr:type III polyketide synthase [Alphaproteobacteria bacterium]
MATTAYINRIAVGVPPHDVHHAFLHFIETLFRKDSGTLELFRRMAARSGIEHRYSCLELAPDWKDGPAMDVGGLYTRGAFANTAARMRMFEQRAPDLAVATVGQLDLGEERSRITHLVVTSCTGFSAPGLDLQVVERCGLPSSVERTMVGFMGCAAAINGLKLARHIVRSEPAARVLVLNLELCTLHLQETLSIPQLLCFMLFADGCAASLVTAEPKGIALDSFRAVLIPDSLELMSWNIRDLGFDMVLSGKVPRAIHDSLRDGAHQIIGSAAVGDIDLWAVHPGGGTILDAVERAFDLPPSALAPSREVLRRHGNMSSATVMFVLEAMMREAASGARGCAMAFGPGLIAETMLFHTVGNASSRAAQGTSHQPARAPALLDG